MNVLVSGGAGYIGSHTAWALRQAGFTPIVLDSLVKGHEWAVRNGPFVQGDIGDADIIRTICRTYKPVALIHFAAFIEVAESVAQPEKYMENNFHKAQILFDTVCEQGIKAAVFSSTAAVYGSPQSDASIKEDHPQKPINPYGESKRLAENYLRTLNDKGLRSFALRYFNAAGCAPIAEGIGEAHHPETHLIPNILLAARGLKPALQIYGSDYPTRDGTAVRDYVHVLDLAMAHVMALKDLLAGGDTDVCNLGTGNGSTVMEVFEAARRAVGQNIPHDYFPRRAGDPAVLVADAGHAYDRLGWKPSFSLNNIVSSAWDWFQSDTYERAIQPFLENLA